MEALPGRKHHRPSCLSGKLFFSENFDLETLEATRVQIEEKRDTIQRVEGDLRELNKEQKRLTKEIEGEGTDSSTDQGNDEGPTRVLPTSRQLPAILKEALGGIRLGACDEGDVVVQAIHRYMLRMGVSPPEATAGSPPPGPVQNEALPINPAGTARRAVGSKDEGKLLKAMARGPYFGSKTKKGKNGEVLGFSS